MKIETRFLIALVVSTAMLGVSFTVMVKLGNAWRVRVAALEKRVDRLAAFESMAKDPKVLRRVLDIYQEGYDTARLYEMGGDYKVGLNVVVSCTRVEVPLNQLLRARYEY